MANGHLIGRRSTERCFLPVIFFALLSRGAHGRRVWWCSLEGKENEGQKEQNCPCPSCLWHCCPRLLAACAQHLIGWSRDERYSGVVPSADRARSTAGLAQDLGP